MKKGMLFIVNIVITKRHKSKNRTIGFKPYMKIPRTTRHNTESNLNNFKKEASYLFKTWNGNSYND